MERLPTDDESHGPAIDRERQRRALIDLYEAQDERARYFGDAEFLHEGLADEDVTELDAVQSAARSEVGCPFCGDVAEYEEDPSDFSILPGCEHYVGRYDSDGQPGSDEYPQLDGGFQFLENLGFPAYKGDDEPTEEALNEAFGQYVDVAIGTYADGLHESGYAPDLMFTMAKRLHLEDRTITGSMVWSMTEFYALDADEALEQMSAAASAIVNGMARLNGERRAEGP